MNKSVGIKLENTTRETAVSVIEKVLELVDGRGVVASFTISEYDVDRVNLNSRLHEVPAELVTTLIDQISLFPDNPRFSVADQKA